MAERTQLNVAGFEDGIMGLRAKECGWLEKVRKEILI